MLACLHYLWLSVGRRNSIYDSGLNVNYKMEGYIMIQMWVVSASALLLSDLLPRQGRGTISKLLTKPLPQPDATKINYYYIYIYNNSIPVHNQCWAGVVAVEGEGRSCCYTDFCPSCST